jgi:hypothetical protein
MTSTKPLALRDGTIVRGLRAIREWRAVEIDRCERGCAVVPAQIDPVLRLGEPALVDRKGRIGPLGTSPLQHRPTRTQPATSHPAPASSSGRRGHRAARNESGQHIVS